jgi:hypothetical protein
MTFRDDLDTCDNCYPGLSFCDMNLSPTDRPTPIHTRQLVAYVTMDWRKRGETNPLRTECAPDTLKGKENAGRLDRFETSTSAGTHKGKLHDFGLCLKILANVCSTEIAVRLFNLITYSASMTRSRSAALFVLARRASASTPGYSSMLFYFSETSFSLFARRKF